MAKKSHGLGRGLDVLLPETDENLGDSIAQIAIGDIDPNPDQPRRTFTEETIAQLAESIREQGVLQPLLVVETNGRYRIVAGERRWRASRVAGLDTVPCIVRDMDTVQQMEIALIENLQREDLNPIETALGIRSLMQQCGYTQEAVAQRLSKSRPAVANLLRLLTLPDEVIALVRCGQLSAGHARVLAGLNSEQEQMLLAKETLEKGYSVRQLEALAAQRREEPVQPKKPAPKPHALPVELTELENRIRETMGVRATLTGTVKKGRIVLNYYSQEELERFNELLARLEED